jgi:hypothetical protein
MRRADSSMGEFGENEVDSVDSSTARTTNNSKSNKLTSSMSEFGENEVDSVDSSTARTTVSTNNSTLSKLTRSSMSPKRDELRKRAEEGEYHKKKSDYQLSQSTFGYHKKESYYQLTFGYHIKKEVIMIFSLGFSMSIPE